MGQSIIPMSKVYQEYLVDESKYTGEAESISFPEAEEELLEILKEVREAGVPVTIQGGKTGITGGSVPEGGHILNLSRMNRVKDSWLCEDGTGRIVVEPGLNLMELQKESFARFRKEALYWPVTPTETSATVGGVAATGAQGITRLLYGDSRAYIEKIRAVDGRGRVLELAEPEALDAFLGKEGITGVITELTLILIPCPEELWGILFFFGEERGALKFIEAMEPFVPREKSGEGARIASAEYLDGEILAMIEARKSTMSRIRELPEVTPGTGGAVYVELHGSEDGIEEIAGALMELAAEYGSDPDAAWAVSGSGEVEKLHAFRHAAPETCNLFIEEARQKDPRITKLGTDMQTKGSGLWEQVSGYRKDLEAAKLKGCIFGHGLEGHLHINLLPDSYESYEAGIRLFRTWAERVRAESGTVLMEHGAGKLKSRIYRDCLAEAYREENRRLKDAYDPEGRLNQGNRFTAEKAGEA